MLDRGVLYDEPVRLTYEAPASCPDSQAFLERLTQRARHVQPVVRDDAELSFEVRIVVDSGEVKGTLKVSSARGEASDERVVTSSSCDEVVSALSLAAALTFDERVEAEQNDAVKSLVGDAPSPSRPPSLASASPPPPAPWRFAFGVHGSAHGGVAPDVTPAVPLFFEVRAPWRARSAFRIGVVRGFASTTPYETGSAEFVWTSGFADGCPYAFESRSVALVPCARFEAGSIHGEANGRAGPNYGVARAWVAFGGAARVRVSPARHWFLEIEASARAPLFRDRFFVWPDTTVFRAAAVAWGLGIGTGVAFP